MRDKKGITVAGSHGKTTTSAMIAHALMKLGQDPSFAVGCGEIVSLKTSGHFGTGSNFVAEGDEYVTDPKNDMTPRFMWQHPEIAVITNIDFDHPDVYENLEAVKKAFVAFIQSLPKNAKVIMNIDNEVAVSLIPQLRHQIITYGLSSSADFHIRNIHFKNQTTHFDVFHKTTLLGTFTLKIPGTHNVLNATGAIAALTLLKHKPVAIEKALASFVGTKRRFEKVGEKHGVLLYDDYAHHPAEIQATLSAASSWFPQKRIVAIFQPHTYSRTKSLLSEFSSCFSEAHKVVLTEIYASQREKMIEGISGATLYAQVQKHHRDAYFASSKEDMLQYLKENVRENDLIITMGAGDIFTWLPQILETF